MALIKEDFIRCTECGHAEFREQRLLTIRKNAKRSTMEVPLPVMGERLAYLCARCGHELDK